MFVHVVLFRLHENLSAQQRQQFEQALQSLQQVKSAQAVYIGRPVAATASRPVVDSNYDYALTVLFDGQAAHDAYQVDPLHKSFLEQCKPLWSQVRVIDAQ